MTQWTTLRRLRRTLAAVAVLAAAVALTPATGVDPIATAAGVGNCTPEAAWPAGRKDYADRVVALVNQHRTSIGRSPFKVSPTLTAAAVWKARHMAQYRYMQHNDPAPPIARTWFQRVQACAYPGSGAGENIAYGYPSPEAVMQAWLNSSGHRANLESSSFRVIGVGAAGASTLYWAQNFGTTDDSGSAPPPAGDTTAPSAPTSLKASAVSTSQISLSWGASTDNVGVTGYRVYRNGTQVATTASLTYADSGLLAGTVYSYTVRAYDAAGNLGAASNSASATTASPPPPPTDTAVPTAPPGLTATATSSSQVSLSWGASTDNVGVTGYRVYRGGVQIGTTASRTWTDSGLLAGATYGYTVRASDAAGNLSTASNTATVTMPAAPPPTSSGAVYPTAVTITSGSLRAGLVSRLGAADGSTLDVYNSTSARKAEWHGQLAAPNTLASLSVRYLGRASALCTQTLAIYNWASGSWVTLDTRSSSSSLRAIQVTPPGSPADYVAGTSGTGSVHVRITCTRSDSTLFWTGADLMSISFS